MLLHALGSPFIRKQLHHNLQAQTAKNPEWQHRQEKAVDQIESVTPLPGKVRQEGIRWGLSEQRNTVCKQCLAAVGQSMSEHP